MHRGVQVVAGHVGGTAAPAIGPVLSMRMDDKSSVFLNLYECQGSNYTRVTGLGHEYCHQRDHQPLRGMAFQRDGRGLRYAYPVDPTSSQAQGQGQGQVQVRYPVILHANGAGAHAVPRANGARWPAQAAHLSSPKLRPLIRLLDPSNEQLRRHPVLLLNPGQDSSLAESPGSAQALSTCRTTTLGALLVEARDTCNASKQCAAKASESLLARAALCTDNT